MSAITLIKRVASRSQHTLLQDAAGVFALFVILVVGLHFPSLV